MLAARARRGLQQAARNLMRFLLSGVERHNYLAPTQGGARCAFTIPSRPKYSMCSRRRSGRRRYELSPLQKIELSWGES